MSGQMTTDVVLAILAMDAYDRASQVTTAGLVLPSAVGAIGSSIGTAKLIDVEDKSGDSFFAIVYSWGGQTIISYRGTDNFFSDAAHGYSTAFGNYDSAC